MIFMRMKTISTDQMITKIAARNCSDSWCADPVYIAVYRVITQSAVPVA